jgi:hypothetical protein
MLGRIDLPILARLDAPVLAIYLTVSLDSEPIGAIFSNCFEKALYFLVKQPVIAFAAQTHNRVNLTGYLFLAIERIYCHSGILLSQVISSNRNRFRHGLYFVRLRINFRRRKCEVGCSEPKH